MYIIQKPSIKREHLQHYKNIPANLSYPSKSVGEVMFNNCDKYHNYTAIKYTLNGITYSEKYDKYAENIELTAKMLKLNGVKKGDKVVVLSPFLPEEYHTKYAIASLGAILVPLHPYEVKKPQGLIEILKENKPTCIICLDSCISVLDEIVTNNQNINNQLNSILYYSPVDALKKNGILSFINPIIEKKYQESGRAPETLSTISNKFKPFREERNKSKHYHGSYMENVNGEDDCVVYYTSGTSGKKPDGCIHTHNSSNSLSLSGNYICDCIKPGQKLILVPGPFHCFGAETGRNTLVNSGVTQIIIPDPKDLKVLSETQKRENAEIQIYVPLILTKMKNSGLFDNVSYEDVELFICGGGALPNPTSEYWQNKLVKTGIREGYGSTQLNGGICINTKIEQKPGSIGIPLPDYYFKLINSETNQIITTPNTPGELYITGPSLFRGIVGKDEFESLIVDEEGVTWYKTNDLVMFDETGWYWFIERIDEIINLDNGNLVNPGEIRTILEEQGIELSVIIKVFKEKDDTSYNKIIVCLEYSGDSGDLELLKTVLKKEFNSRLLKYEIPSEIIIFDRLPLSLNGKPVKKEIKEKYQSDDYLLKLVL